MLWCTFILGQSTSFLPEMEQEKVSASSPEWFPAVQGKQCVRGQSAANSIRATWGVLSLRLNDNLFKCATRRTLSLWHFVYCYCKRKHWQNGFPAEAFQQSRKICSSLLRQPRLPFELMILKVCPFTSDICKSAWQINGVVWQQVGIIYNHLFMVPAGKVNHLLFSVEKAKASLPFRLHTIITLKTLSCLALWHCTSLLISKQSDLDTKTTLEEAWQHLPFASTRKEPVFVSCPSGQRVWKYHTLL